MSDTPASPAKDQSMESQVPAREQPFDSEPYPVSQMIIPCLLGAIFCVGVVAMGLYSISEIGGWGVVIAIAAFAAAVGIFSIHYRAISAEYASVLPEEAPVEQQPSVPELPDEDQERVDAYERKMTNAFIGMFTPVVFLVASAHPYVWWLNDQPWLWIFRSACIVTMITAACIHRKYEKEVEAIRRVADETPSLEQ